MPETQDGFRERMQASGKWPEFVAYRSSLEDHGRDKRTAWIEAARAFGFDGSYSTRSKPKAERVALIQDAPAEVFEGKSSNVRGDFAWVYSNMGVADISPEEAPSSGAWGLLEFARAEPREFYKSWMSMVSRQTDHDDVMEGFREDATRSTNEIAEMLQSLESTVVRESPEDDEGEPGVSGGTALDGSGGSVGTEGSLAGVQS